MTAPLFRDDAYLREAPATVLRITDEGGIVPDASLFYAQGGGQPGDSGWLAWDGEEIAIGNAVKGDGDEIVLLPRPERRCPRRGSRCDNGWTGTAAIATCACIPACTFCRSSYRCR